jgi:hypothetical protein
MSYSDLQASLVGTSGSTVTVSVHNPQSQGESARVTISVSLSGGGTQTLTSPNFAIAAGATKQLHLSAAGPIASITDGPTPIEPL